MTTEARDIYAVVSQMRKEALDSAEIETVEIRADLLIEAKAFLRIMHMLEDDFGVPQTWPQLGASK